MKNKTEFPRDVASLKVRINTTSMGIRIVVIRRACTSPKYGRTRCQDEQESRVGMPHLPQMLYENISKLGKISISVKRPSSVTKSSVGIMFDWRSVLLCMNKLQNVS